MLFPHISTTKPFYNHRDMKSCHEERPEMYLISSSHLTKVKRKAQFGNTGKNFPEPRVMTVYT